jgi:hypothetical protein
MFGCVRCAISGSRILHRVCLCVCGNACMRRGALHVCVPFTLQYTYLPARRSTGKLLHSFIGVHRDKTTHTRTHAPAPKRRVLLARCLNVHATHPSCVGWVFLINAAGGPSVRALSSRWPATRGTEGHPCGTSRPHRPGTAACSTVRRERPHHQCAGRRAILNGAD